MVGLNLTADDVTAAIRRRTRRSPPAGSARSRTRSTSRSTATVLVKGQLAVAGRVRRDRPARQSRRLDRAPADVARLEVGARDLQFLAPASTASRLPASASSCRRPATPWRPREAVRAKMEELARFFPAGRRIRRSPTTPRPSSKVSIEKVIAHADRGDRARLRRDVPVPAELPLHDHPDARRAGRAARHLRGDAGRPASRSTC